MGPRVEHFGTPPAVSRARRIGHTAGKGHWYIGPQIKCARWGPKRRCQAKADKASRASKSTVRVCPAGSRHSLGHGRLTPLKVLPKITAVLPIAILCCETPPHNRALK